MPVIRTVKRDASSPIAVARRPYRTSLEAERIYLKEWEHPPVQVYEGPQGGRFIYLTSSARLQRWLRARRYLPKPADFSRS